jgi:xanthine dehydrogenase YagT iron-sulfur-binding subunit
VILARSAAILARIGAILRVLSTILAMRVSLLARIAAILRVLPRGERFLQKSPGHAHPGARRKGAFVKRDDTRDDAGREPDASQPAGPDPAEITTQDGLSRRVFLALSLGAVPAVSLAAASVKDVKARAAQPVPGSAVMPVRLNVNGQERQLRLDPRTSLLDALREDLALAGTKKGCDHGQCGACTVLVDGRRVLSCLTLAAMASGHKVTTVEGLAQGDRLHPVQAAFLKHDAFQCGYCTPGQIVSAVGLLAEGCPDDPAAIRECMSGNLCRCGAYPNIVAAVREAKGGRTS